MPALVVAATHLAHAENLGSHQGVDERRLAGTALAEQDGATSGLDELAHLFDTAPLRHAERHNGHTLPHGAAHLRHDGLEALLPAAAVGLCQQHTRRDAALARKHHRAHEAVAHQVALGKRLGHEHGVDVCGKHLPGTPGAAVPAGELGGAGKDRLDDRLVMPLRRVEHDPVAHGSTKVAETILYERYRMLGTAGPLGRLHKGVTPVKADDAAQARADKLLARLLALFDECPELVLYALLDREIPECRLEIEHPALIGPFKAGGAIHALRRGLACTASLLGGTTRATAWLSAHERDLLLW